MKVRFNPRNIERAGDIADKKKRNDEKAQKAKEDREAKKEAERVKRQDS